jgi:nucleotidyltransferase substrate binding protein (TIGR01987 family)
MTERWILDDFSAALAQQSAALSTPADSDLVKAGCIQYFEFSFELAWKSIKIAAASMGLEECSSPKACLRLAFAQGWIGEEDVGLTFMQQKRSAPDDESTTSVRSRRSAILCRHRAARWRERIPALRLHASGCFTLTFMQACARHP